MIFQSISIKSIPVDDITESLLPSFFAEPLPVVPEALRHVLRLGDGGDVRCDGDLGVQPERVGLLRCRTLLSTSHLVMSMLSLKAFPFMYLVPLQFVCQVFCLFPSVHSEDMLEQYQTLQNPAHKQKKNPVAEFRQISSYTQPRYLIKPRNLILVSSSQTLV